MILHHLVYNPYEVNAFIIAADDGQCILVDPACCSPAEQIDLKKFIADKGLRPVWLINTHGHYDHIAGNSFVSQTWSSLKISAHRDDVIIMEKGYDRGAPFGFPANKPPAPNVLLDDGDSVDIGEDVSLQVLHIPGHSPGSIALYSPVQKWVIVGDVLFNGSIGRTDLPGGDFDLLIDGIKNKLLNLPSDTAVLTGHGPFTTIGQEKANNPYLKSL